MTSWRSATMALATAVLVNTQLHAQIPAAAATAATPAATTAATGAVGAPNNIWSKLCMTPEQKAACKQKLCASPILQFIGGAVTPYRALSGGLIPKCCPGPNDPNPADLKLPADSAEGAASRIKQKEADAKKRRLAIRYLGTVDCRRYPEAEAALVNGLRADENECVRWEAAIALSRGCCCTRKVLDALVLTVSGRKSNDPAEMSYRVRAAASVALEKCLACYVETDDASSQPIAPERPVPPAPPAPGAPAAPGEPDLPVPQQQPQAIRLIVPNLRLEDARRVLAWHKSQQPRVPVSIPQPSSEPVLAQPGIAPAEPAMLRSAAQMATMIPPAEAPPSQPAAQRRDVLSLMIQAWHGQ